MFMKSPKTREFTYAPRSYDRIEKEKEDSGKRFDFKKTRRFELPYVDLEKNRKKTKVMAALIITLFIFIKFFMN